MSCATRVLIADDNDADRLLLATIVKRHGYDVALAANGVEALEQLEILLAVDQLAGEQRSVVARCP